MRIVSHRKLKDFYTATGCENSRVALERWYHVTLKAEWKSLSEVKADFPATDYAGNQRYVFNIKGNNRLVVVIKFTMGYVFIRFVGTHEEYSKTDCSTI
jgi:mRNA interferase HigB